VGLRSRIRNFWRRNSGIVWGLIATGLGVRWLLRGEIVWGAIAVVGGVLILSSGVRWHREAAALKRGRRLLQGDSDEEYVAFVQEAGRRFPRSAEIQWMVTGVMVFEEQPDEEVAAQAAKTAALGADDPTIQVWAGFHLIDTEDGVEPARLCATRAEELAGKDFVLSADLERLKGRIDARDGNFAAAEEKFRSALIREAEWSASWTTLARFLWARGRSEEALSVLAEALSRFREDDDGSRRPTEGHRDSRRTEKQNSERSRRDGSLSAAAEGVG
jgi:tetratricopeptide (TPR) repeat protein